MLEQELNGLIGELGFDFGVDYQGNVWLFEANSKPGRSIFHTLPYEKRINKLENFL
ncbi:YheC/YheD family protein [Priestia megaterium]